jgi:hypothetical protein
MIAVTCEPHWGVLYKSARPEVRARPQNLLIVIVIIIRTQSSTSLYRKFSTDLKSSDLTGVLVRPCVRPGSSYRIYMSIQCTYYMPNLSYHSVNPVSLPSQAHQISSSSSLASVAVIETGLVGRDMLFSGLVWQPMRTPSVLTLAAPRGRGLPSFPIVDSALTRPESTRKSRNIASMDLQTFCRGSHVGCEKRRGARSSMCVCVGATISHKLVDRLISKSWCEQSVHRGLTGALT